MPSKYADLVAAEQHGDGPIGVVDRESMATSSVWGSAQIIAAIILQ